MNIWCLCLRFGLGIVYVGVCMFCVLSYMVLYVLCLCVDVLCSVVYVVASRVYNLCIVVYVICDCCVCDVEVVHVLWVFVNLCCVLGCIFVCGLFFMMAYVIANLCMYCVLLRCVLPYGALLFYRCVLNVCLHPCIVCVVCVVCLGCVCLLCMCVCLL